MSNYTAIINFFDSARVRNIVLYLLFAGLLNIYLFKNYRPENHSIKKITCYSNIHDILIYVLETDGEGFDYSKPIRPGLSDSVYTFDLATLKIRNFRLHFGEASDRGCLKQLQLHFENGDKLIYGSDIITKDVALKKNSSVHTLLFTCESNGFIELKKSTITSFEFFKSELLIVLFSGLMLVALNISIQKKISLSGFNVKSISVALFLFSIFLPHPLFNIALILSMLIVILDFNYRRFTSNKIGLLFALYFLYFILNNLFVSVQFSRSFFETLLPFAILPIYFACVPRGNYLVILPLTALCFGLYFISTACLNIYLFKNPAYFSFDAFTLKYLHPVYFSYLILFALMYLEIQDTIFNKKIAIPTLVFCLICCGSKLIITLTFIFYLSLFFRKRKLAGYLFITIGIIALLAFAPTRKRFIEIADPKNLSILNEPVIKSYHDPRLNGLTLRLLLWQESICSVNTPLAVIFGNGVDKHSELLLESSLKQRGLEVGHSKYDPHNQFIATYYKMGSIGLLILLLICSTALNGSFIVKNKLLLCTALLFIIAMLTESVLQRIVGINFFISILLLLSGTFFSQQNLENSDSRNERHTQ